MDNTKRKILLVTIGTFITLISCAQQYNIWFRGTLSAPVRKKFKIDSEFQHRRQNGLGNNNPLDKKQMSSFRNWLHYQHTEGLRLVNNLLITYPILNVVGGIFTFPFVVGTWLTLLVKKLFSSKKPVSV